MPLDDFKFELPSIFNTINWKKAYPRFVGLEDFFNNIDLVSKTSTNFPPYNIIRVDDKTSLIEIAIAGFKQEEIQIKLHEQKLEVSASKENKEEGSYLYKGISSRSFKLDFVLASGVEIKEASLEEGLLTIRLVDSFEDFTKTIPITSKKKSK